MLKQKSGFLLMVLSIVGVVLYVTMFSEILTAMETIRTYANIATFTALLTVVKIAPVVLLLAGVFGAGFGFYKGYKGSEAQDSSGMLRMVLGIIMIILFVTLFYTILTSFYTLYNTDNASEYIAFQTVVQIAPTVLFLSGIFAGGATAVSGAKKFRSKRKSKLT